MFVFGWAVLSLAVAIYAQRLKRSAGSWFFASVFFSPLLAGIILLACGPNNESEEAHLPPSSHQWNGRGGPDLNDATEKALASDLYLNTIKTAFELYQKKLLTEDEFKRTRSEALLKFTGARFNEESLSVLSKMIPLIDCGAIEAYDIEQIKIKVGLAEAS